MRDFPRVRWLALLLAIAFGVIFAGVDFSVAAALAHLGSKAAALGAGMLGVAKIIEEALRGIGVGDQYKAAIDADEDYYHTMGRGVEQSSFWRRVL